jgi:deoxyribodipyrimidine photolyase-related protein
VIAAEQTVKQMSDKRKVLRLILGDQLNSCHSWFKTPDPEVTYTLMELRSETDYVTHHIQKITGFFAAMREFTDELRKQGHQVIYFRLNDLQNRQSFADNCKALIEEYNFNHFEYQLPDEYRVDQHLGSFSESLNILVNVCDSEHFFTSRSTLSEFFKGKKTYLMESFYRMMRRENDVLMEGDQPLSGQWNFDHDNRKKLPKEHVVTPPILFGNDISTIAEDIRIAGITTIGSIDNKRFVWPVNRNQSLELLNFFVTECLPLFGTYEDAMTVSSWSVYHSRLSFSMNVKMISPREVIGAAVEAWKADSERITFNQLEGFVRQIIGWREFMRGVYWAKMPEYASLNYFEHNASLPEWFWDGKTKMNCLKHAIGQSLDHAYAHHIQRLMVTGNFALLAGVHPDEVDKWYLGIYIDALDWVEITNTRGMSQFADGGIVGTKPYVSSATYIHKMSDYCNTCFYNKSKKVGERSCPFNSLYWNFYDRHAEKLQRNPRIGMRYKVWERMAPDQKADVLEQAEFYLSNINEL